MKFIYWSALGGWTCAALAKLADGHPWQALLMASNALWVIVLWGRDCERIEDEQK